MLFLLLETKSLDFVATPPTKGTGVAKTYGGVSGEAALFGTVAVALATRLQTDALHSHRMRASRPVAGLGAPIGWQVTRELACPSVHGLWQSIETCV